MEGFKRDRAVERGVVGFVDNAHSTLTQLLDNLVVGNCLANHVVFPW